jgi:hypothetical protein
MTDNADYTPDQGLTTEQIAAAGPGSATEATPAPADDSYDASNYDADNYDDNAYDDDNVGTLGNENARPLGDDTAAPLGAAPTTSEQANRGASDVDHRGSVTTAPGQHASLLDDGELQSITMRWKDIQAEFVDEPTKAVHEADALVAELMQRLAMMFSTERAELENRLADGNDVSTEELRQGLRLYRSFFERLLAA